MKESGIFIEREQDNKPKKISLQGQGHEGSLEPRILLNFGGDIGL